MVTLLKEDPVDLKVFERSFIKGKKGFIIEKMHFSGRHSLLTRSEAYQ
jgi:hypothetical protein